MNDVKPPSVIVGAAIVTGTAVGAGMFSIPVVSSGMWFSWSLLLLALTWFCMYHSSLMILEVNLNYEPGASFDTFIGDTLGPRWNAFNGLTLVFVLYILTYAYISGGGSIIRHSLEGTIDVEVPQKLAGIAFALILACVVWASTALVSRVTTIFVGGMLITYMLSAGSLASGFSLPLLLDNKPEYLLYALAAVPYYLASFGYHGCVPSLMKFYGRDPARIRSCLLIGSLMSLLIYTCWNLVIMGNISREMFKPIIAAGGNIGDLMAALGSTSEQGRLSTLLNAFANMAVISSFLGVSLSLFDFIADKFNFDDSPGGRLKTALVTFLPPAIGGVFFPHGFIHAIGLAGLCACVWGSIVPAMAARASRRTFGNPRYRVWGGNVMIYVIMGYGVLLASCYLLTAMGLLRQYG